MNQKGYIIIGLLLFLGVGSAVGLSQTKWNLGYEKAIRVDIEPEFQYFSVAGIEDKRHWDKPWVQARARLLADMEGYEGDDIACDGNGTKLYIGVDKKETK